METIFCALIWFGALYVIVSGFLYVALFIAWGIFEDRIEKWGDKMGKEK